MAFKKSYGSEVIIIILLPYILMHLSCSRLSKGTFDLEYNPLCLCRIEHFYHSRKTAAIKVLVELTETAAFSYEANHFR